jgi:hypothetical protein
MIFLVFTSSIMETGFLAGVAGTDFAGGFTGSSSLSSSGRN